MLYQLFFTNLKRFWVFPFSSSVTENWTSRKSKKRLSGEFISVAIFRNYRCISALAAIYFHSDTAWQFFWEKGREGVGDGGYRKSFLHLPAMCGKSVSRIWHVVCLPACLLELDTAPVHTFQSNWTAEHLCNSLTPDQQSNHIWLKHSFVLVS